MLAPQFQIVRQVGVTPGRVCSLLYACRLLNTDDTLEARVHLDRARLVSRDPRGDAVVNNEDAFGGGMFIATLKENGVFTDTPFHRERVVMRAGALVDVAEKVFADPPARSRRRRRHCRLP